MLILSLFHIDVDTAMCNWKIGMRRREAFNMCTKARQELLMGKGNCFQGATSTFVVSCPGGQVRFNSHLPHSNFHLPLTNCMFYNVSFEVEHGAGMSKHIFQDKLGCQTTKLAHVLKSKPEIYTAVFTSASAIIFKFCLIMSIIVIIIIIIDI